MTNVRNLEVYRLLKKSGASIAKTREELKEELADIQAFDVSILSARDLRKLRDNLLWIKRTLALLDPDTQKRLRERIEQADGRELRQAEVFACILETPTVRLV